MSAGRPRARVAAALAVAVAAATAVACAPQAPEAAPPATASARPLTTDEAQTLAMMRFTNFDAGARAVSFTVVDAGDELRVEGWFDYRSETGVGSIEGDDLSATVQWNPDYAALGPASPGAPAPAAQPVDADWAVSVLDAASSRLHAVFSVIGALGSDRPENPLLLQQTGALALGEVEVDGVETSVFAGPASDDVQDADAEIDPDASGVHYFVDDTGLVRRVDVRLGAGDGWTSIAFGPADGVTIADPFEGVAP